MPQSSLFGDGVLMTSLDEQLTWHDGVLDTGTILAYLSPRAIRWRVESGRWQQPCRGVVVSHSGPLTDSQMLRVAMLWAGPGAALAGLTAARLQGLRGFDDWTDAIHVLIPASRTARGLRPPMRLAIHYSRNLLPADIHPVRQPPRTRIARSLVDAAAWMATDRGAQAVLAAGVQQRLVRVTDLVAEADRNERLHRRRLIKQTLSDIAGGARALSELDFTRLVVRRFGLPEPDRQVPRHDADGKRRWLDAAWEKAAVIAEIDGAGHVDVLRYWEDMDRDNVFQLRNYRVLRYPAFAVRYHPEYVADQIRQALREAGYSC
jgi:hypothetical protein